MRTLESVRADLLGADRVPASYRRATNPHLWATTRHGWCLDLPVNRDWEPSDVVEVNPAIVMYGSRWGARLTLTDGRTVWVEASTNDGQMYRSAKGHRPAGLRRLIGAGNPAIEPY